MFWLESRDIANWDRAVGTMGSKNADARAHVEKCWHFQDSPSPSEWRLEHFVRYIYTPYMDIYTYTNSHGLTRNQRHMHQYI